MTSGDDQILARLQTDYGHTWTVGRTFTDRAKKIPNWWTATRHRNLTNRELERGLSQTLIYDTARLLRAALDAQADIEARDPASL